jgi:hypothetical protein
MKLEFELKVPHSMSSIKLGDYQKYVKIVKQAEKDEDSDDFLKLKMLEIFCNLPLKDSYQLPLSVFEGAIAQTINCLNEKTPLIKTFHMTDMDGDHAVEFGFIPNLNDMSFGEYVDLDSTISEMDTLHRAMAVLYRPIVEKKKEAYSVMKYEGFHEYAELMKDMPLDVALGALVFFYRLGIKLSKYMMGSSLKQLEMTPQQRLDLEKKLLLLNGVGTNQYMRSLEEMSQGLMRLPNNHLENVSAG